MSGDPFVLTPPSPDSGVSTLLSPLDDVGATIDLVLHERRVLLDAVKAFLETPNFDTIDALRAAVAEAERGQR